MLFSWFFSSSALIGIVISVLYYKSDCQVRQVNIRGLDTNSFYELLRRGEPLLFTHIPLDADVVTWQRNSSEFVKWLGPSERVIVSQSSSGGFEEVESSLNWPQAEKFWQVFGGPAAEKKGEFWSQLGNKYQACSNDNTSCVRFVNNFVVVRPERFQTTVADFFYGQKKQNITEYIQYESASKMCKAKLEKWFGRLAAPLWSRLQFVSMWIARRKTRAGNHFDDNENLFLQLVGTRIWKLEPPGTDHKNDPKRGYMLEVSSNSTNSSDVSLSYFVAVPTTISSVKNKIFCYQRAGTLLYIPTGWWHQVETKIDPNVGYSLGLNSWFEPFESNQVSPYFEPVAKHESLLPLLAPGGSVATFSHKKPTAWIIRRLISVREAHFLTSTLLPKLMSSDVSLISAGFSMLHAEHAVNFSPSIAPLLQNIRLRFKNLLKHLLSNIDDSLFGEVESGYFALRQPGAPAVNLHMDNHYADMNKAQLEFLPNSSNTRLAALVLSLSAADALTAFPLQNLDYNSTSDTIAQQLHQKFQKQASQRTLSFDHTGSPLNHTIEMVGPVLAHEIYSRFKSACTRRRYSTENSISLLQPGDSLAFTALAPSDAEPEQLTFDNWQHDIYSLHGSCRHSQHKLIFSTFLRLGHKP